MTRTEKLISWSIVTLVCLFLVGRFFIVGQLRSAMAQTAQNALSEKDKGSPSTPETLRDPVPDELDQRIDSAVQLLNAAQDEQQKQAARADLRQQLSKIFDDDMRDRDTQAQEIQTRLDNLRQLYQERMKRKDEIIDRQLKVLEDQARGLGFPHQASSTARLDIHRRKRQEKTLAKFLTDNAAMVSELSQHGHYIESPNATLYAYVNGNYPNGPSELRVVNSQTGELVASARFNTLIGPVQFTDQAVAARDINGILQPLIPLNKNLLAGASDTTGVEPPGKKFMDDFTLLRDNYVKARSGFAAIEEIKKTIREPEASQLIQQAKVDWANAQEVYKAAIDILAIDLEKASVAANAEKTKLTALEKLFASNAVSSAEVNEQRVRAETSALEVTRIKRLLDLFRSIEHDPLQTQDASSGTGEPLNQ